MSVQSETHVVTGDGRCVRCGCEIPGLRQLVERQQVYVGDRIGSITTTYTKPVAYKVGERDSNEPCKEVTK